MKVVFAGPSIYGAEIDTTGLDMRGPAAQGDITRAISDGATVIGLIDGVFSSVAAVWHKEVLFALNRGVAVYGAASMGALRAAECASFGMVPVGQIAHAYLSGELDDDGAVALTLLPQEFGWQPTSEPLVDVWATLDHLLILGVLRDDLHQSLLSAAAQQHFTTRTPESIVGAVLDGEEAVRLSEAYTHHHVSQKRLDAVALINLLRDQPVSPCLVPWCFEDSPMWQSFLGSTNV